MEICDDDHPYIAFDNSGSCPACLIRDRMQNKIDNLTEEREAAIRESEELDAELHKLSEELQQYKGLKETLEAMVSERL